LQCWCSIAFFYVIPAAETVAGVGASCASGNVAGIQLPLQRYKQLPASAFASVETFKYLSCNRNGITFAPSTAYTRDVGTSRTKPAQ